MFGSWKSRGGSEAVVVPPHLWHEDDDILSEIEEELSAFIQRQRAWPEEVQKAKKLPSWLKTASLNRCDRTPPLPPKVTPTPPPRSKRSCSRVRGSSVDLPSLSGSTCSPTPPSCRKAESLISGASKAIPRQPLMVIIKIFVMKADMQSSVSLLKCA